MRTNSENSRINNPRISGMKLNHVVLAINISPLLIPSDGPTVWGIDGGLVDRVIRLPTLEAEKQLVIGNTGATNNLSITDSAGNLLATAPPLSMFLFFALYTRWIWIGNTFFASSSLAVATTTYNGSSNILASDINVQVNAPGVAVMTLPLSTNWTAAGGLHGLPLSIFDISGAAQANNITINPSGAELISGQANIVIDGNWSGFRLRPASTGGWVVV